PRLLRVTLESIHHRQCPLLHLAVNVAGFAAEKESLIRVSLTLCLRCVDHSPGFVIAGWEVVMQ
ncbi:MAG: hypothetical protein ABSG11_16210, partial [Candidatus Korobacteraceae bacterium]